MPITNQQLQEKFMDAIGAIEAAEQSTKNRDEIKAAKTALTRAKQALDQVGPPPVISGQR